jgi:hypothetical protein
MFEKRISGKTQVGIVNEFFKESEVYLLKTIGQLMGMSASGLTNGLDPDQTKLINDALSYWANTKKLCTEYIHYNENEKELLNERLDRQDKLLEEISEKLDRQNELIEKLSQKKDK